MPRLFDAPCAALVAAALLGLPVAVAQPDPATIVINERSYPLHPEQSTPPWLQIEVVILRHTGAVDERASRPVNLSYPEPLLVLTDPEQIAAERAAAAQQRGLELLGERLTTQPHNRWQAALITDLTTLYDPFFDPEQQPSAVADQPTAAPAVVPLDEPPQPPRIDFSQLQIEPAFWQLRQSQLTLRDSARAIARDDSYELLSHFGWRQPSDESSAWIAVRGGDKVLDRHPLEGALRLVKSRFHHLETALWWAQLELEQHDATQAEPAIAIGAELDALLTPPLALPLLPEQLSAPSSDAEADSEQPRWSLGRALLTAPSNMAWTPPLTPLQRWTLNQSPFKLTTRILTAPYRDQPLAVANGYRDLLAALQDQPPATALAATADQTELPASPAEPAAPPTQEVNSLLESEQSVEVASQQPLPPRLLVEQLWTVQERRRVEAGNDYYIDHPVLGIIVRVSEVAPHYTTLPGVELPAGLTELATPP